MYKYLGITLVVLALALAIVPHYTDCLSQGQTVTLVSGATQPMKCHWSAQAEIAVAAPLGVVGALMVFSRKKESVRYLAITGIVLGGLAMLIPTKIIGVCGMPTHICASTMKPALLGLGGLVAASGLVGLVMALRSKTPDR